MSYHWKRLIRKIPKYEQELHINTEPFSSTCISLLSQDDYQASRTVVSLAPNSKWLIVRNNIHKIRSWTPLRRLSVIDQPCRDWHVFFQMKRELKRAEEQIRAIQYRSHFTPIQYFDLYIDETCIQRYNVSHVQSTDEIYYSGLSSEPIVLQYLLYYFSQECRVPYNSIFHPFLSDVNAVLNTNYQRLQRVVVLRRLAFMFTSGIFIILFIMFFSLILSVLTTTWNLSQMYKNNSDEGIEKSTIVSSLSAILTDEQ